MAMSQIEQSIEVDVPVQTAYNQWTQFEDFPQFMEGVERVDQLDDQRLHWTAEIGGVHREWDARITEQIPDERIAWTSTEGIRNGGVVTFHRLSDARTKIMLQVDYDPEGFVENVGDAIGLTRSRIAEDLMRFKRMMESVGEESGAWRGEIHEH
jgi:uncharacterized membrane protein